MSNTAYVAQHRKECSACKNAPVSMARAEYLISRLLQASANVRGASTQTEMDDAAVSFGIYKDAIINALLGKDGE